MKRSTKGCLIAVGALVTFFVIIVIISAVISPPEDEESPATTETPAETEREEPSQRPLVEVELIEAQSEGLVAVSAYGTDTLEFIKLDIASYSDDRLDITILPGTLFEPLSDAVQSMVVMAEKELSLQPHESTGSFAVKAASINMQLDVPADTDTLSLTTPATAEFMKLLDTAEFQDESSRIQQFALWTITDNPKREEYVSIGNRGPSDEEMERIRGLFASAGIPAEEYRALRMPLRIELAEAQSRGLIELSASGKDAINYVQISLTSKSDDVLEVAVLPGTIFESQAASVQSMVVIVEEILLLYAHETVGPVSISAACANMELDVPSESDSLTLSAESAPEDLVLLLNLPDFHKEDFRVRQFAIWTITDNPERDEYIGIGTFGFGTGPSDEEIEIIQLLFDKAGISTGQYRALS